MQFTSPLQPATLIKRYKRFLADAITPDGQFITLHCANTGAMTGCATPGDTIWYSTSDNPKRRYPYSWQLTQTQSGDFIAINTLLANQVVYQALLSKQLTPFCDYLTTKTEVKYGSENSRIDFLLQAKNQVNCYIEVKSVTLQQNGQGFFPDAITLRGQKHLRELCQMVAEGQRAVLFFVVMHTAIRQVSPAAHIDSTYAHLLHQAHSQGVQIICYGTHISPEGILLKAPLPVIIN